MYYSLTQLYRGERIDWSDYKDYKLTSLVLSVSTCGFATAARASSTLVKAISKKFLIELSKASVKTAIFTFIEDNIGQGINNNIMGLQNVLNGILKSSEYEIQIDILKANTEALRKASYEKSQAQKYLNELLKSISGDGKSSYQLRLEKTMTKIQTRLIFGMIKNLAKYVLPVQGFTCIGAFGSNQKVITQCSNEIMEFILTTLIKLNESIQNKTKKLESESQELFHGDERPSEAEFQIITKSFITSMESKFRTQIADHMIEQLTGKRVKQRMYDTITSGYAAILSDSKLTMTDFVEVPDAEAMKPEDEADGNNPASQKYMTTQYSLIFPMYLILERAHNCNFILIIFVVRMRGLFQMLEVVLSVRSRLNWGKTILNTFETSMVDFT